MQLELRGVKAENSECVENKWMNLDDNLLETSVFTTWFLPLNMRVSPINSITIWAVVKRFPYCPSLPAMSVSECRGSSFPLNIQYDSIIE